MNGLDIDNDHGAIRLFALSWELARPKPEPCACDAHDSAVGRQVGFGLCLGCCSGGRKGSAGDTLCATLASELVEWQVDATLYLTAAVEGS